MSKAVSLLFPHQLYQHNPVAKMGQPIYLVEEHLYFKQYSFHQQKLVLHRASMKYYEQYLQTAGFTVHYIDHQHRQSDCSQLIKTLAGKGVNEIHVVDVIDNWLMKKIKKTCEQSAIKLIIVDSPNFLNTTASVADYFNNRKTYFQTDFYTWQRKQRGS